MATREVVLIRDSSTSSTENCGGAFGFLHGASESLRRPFVLVSVGAIGFIVTSSAPSSPASGSRSRPCRSCSAAPSATRRPRPPRLRRRLHPRPLARAHWPTFNVADIAITVGIGLMLLEYVVGPKPAKKLHQKPA